MTLEVVELAVAEQFYSIQGEGPHAGTPAVFLRLAGCNLCCGGRENLDRDPEDFEAEGDATWVCDTIDVWREADRSVPADDLVDEWDRKGWLNYLDNGAHLVVTGGEPMMAPHQDALLGLIAELNREDIVPFVEVETNGTIEPRNEIATYVDQWNVSVKLSNSGMPEDERINEEAIDYFKWVHNDDPKRDARFKFVVGHEASIPEIQNLAISQGIPDDMISLMPAGQTRHQLQKSYPIVAEVCKENGWQMSPRLQIDTWNQATGV